MKKFSFIIILLISVSGYKLTAQQSPMFSQNMYNPLRINPAYAGTKEGFILVGMGRMQWLGVEDSPKTATLSLHGPIFENMGLGLSLTNDVIGPVQTTDAYLSYAYQVDVSFDTRLSFGISAGFKLMNLDLTKKPAYNPSDPQIYALNNQFFPNVGVGIFFYSYNGYIGVSVPRILEQKIDPNSVGSAKIVRDYYLTGGYVFDLDEVVKIKPAFTVRYTLNAPLSIDLSTNIYYTRWGFGVGYRYQDAITGLFQLFLTREFSVGYSYDYTLTELRHDSWGSHEIMFRYDFTKQSRCRPAKYF